VISGPNTPPPPAALAQRAWGYALVFLLLIAGLRGATLVGHDPMIGLANNYDMVRVQACIDAYPVRGADVPPAANSWQAPISRYTFVEGVGAPCFFTSEALIAFAAKPLLVALAAASGDDSFPLQAIGWIKLVLLLGLGVMVSTVLAVRGRPFAAIVNATLVALVLADPGVTVYFNALYAESAAVIFAYAALAAIYLHLDHARASGIWLALAATGLFLATVSKLQHVVLGLIVLIALLLAAVVTSRRTPRRLLAAVAAAATLGAMAQMVHLNAPSTETIARANITNTVLEAVLGSSADPHRTASRLGLPPHCADAAGKNWFAPGMETAHPCPEVFALSRASIVSLAFLEPRTVLAVFASGVERARPWVPAYLGKVEGGTQAPLPGSIPTLSSALDRLPWPLFAALVLAPLPLTVLLLMWRPRELPTAAAFALTFGAIYPPLALATVVFGDGFADTAKQFHLGMTVMLCFWLVLASVVLGRRSVARG
jgi:hypothetical protein